MKYFWGVFCVFQTALIVGKVFDIEPISNQSWMQVASPILGFIITANVTLWYLAIVNFIKSKTGN